MRPLLNVDELATWARAQGFRDLVPSAWHVTVINSRAGLDRQAIDLQTHTLHLPASPSRYITRMGDFIVIVIESVELRRRNETLRLTAPERDFFSYTPHVTFSTSRRRDLGNVEAFAGPLVFGPEVMEPGERPMSRGGARRIHASDAPANAHQRWETCCMCDREPRSMRLSRRGVLGATTALPVLPGLIVPDVQSVADQCKDWLAVNREIERLALRWASLEVPAINPSGGGRLSLSEDRPAHIVGEMARIDDQLGPLEERREIGLEALAKKPARTVQDVADKLKVAACMLGGEGGPINEIVAEAANILDARET